MHDEQEQTPVTAPETGEADSAAAEFEELIQGRCKQPFQQRVQKILEGRLRTLRQENEALRRQAEESQSGQSDLLEKTNARSAQVSE